MINKSALRESVNEVLELHDLTDPDLEADLIDRLCLDLEDEIFDDEDEEEKE
jgi:hypothetical protein